MRGDLIISEIQLIRVTTLTGLKNNKQIISNKTLNIVKQVVKEKPHSDTGDHCANGAKKILPF